LKLYFFRIFPALEDRDFVLYFIGMFVSFGGTWLQIETLKWLVKETTNSAEQVGMISFLSFLPVFLLSIFGGVLVDRFDKKHVLYCTQLASMVQASILSYLTFHHKATLGELKLLVLLMGLINAIDGPARHSLLMFTTKSVRSASAINTSLVMAGQAIGGVLTGYLVPRINFSGAFMVNAVSFIPVFMTLWLIKTKSVTNEQKPHPIRAVKEGWHYLWNRKTMLAQIMLIGILSALGFSYRAIMPIIASSNFHTGAVGFGMLSAAVGVGAFVSSVFNSANSKKLAVDEILFRACVFFGLIVLGTSLIVMMGSHSIVSGVLFCTLAGLGATLASSVLRGAVLDSLSSGVRGRIMGFFQTFFVGGISFGSWTAGRAAENFGSARTVIAVGCLTLTVAGIAFIFRKQVVVHVHE